jgi:hypothetical protein
MIEALSSEIADKNGDVRLIQSQPANGNYEIHPER